MIQLGTLGGRFELPSSCEHKLSRLAPYQARLPQLRPGFIVRCYLIFHGRAYNSVIYEKDHVYAYQNPDHYYSPYIAKSIIATA